MPCTEFVTKSGGASELFFRCAVLISESIVEKSVDCPPTVPQYCWRTALLPPYTTVVAPSSFAIVICRAQIH